MIGAKRADAAGSEQVKSRFFFTVVNTSEVKHKLSTFRDPLGLDAFNRVVDQLRAEGFNVTEAKPGKACVAAFQVRFSGFEVCAASITSLLWLTEHEARDLEREPEVTTNGLTE